MKTYEDFSEDEEDPWGEELSSTEKDILDYSSITTMLHILKIWNLDYGGIIVEGTITEDYDTFNYKRIIKINDERNLTKSDIEKIKKYIEDCEQQLKNQ